MDIKEATSKGGARQVTAFGVIAVETAALCRAVTGERSRQDLLFSCGARVRLVVVSG